ncbi:hypothetical protein [Mesorhizobium sp. WSM4313]|uniref:hypothetical protein n=1 Tax=Mesorhizobium sp. WSM4313 TaxID=2029412 RepID=UPI000BAEC5EA|nr:hypothetical protein [Mesorhizobium sp. WSM4313]PBB21132.1 hypothetical protein CK219_00390 [Mesorhizobium sp. WSM4313]
MSGIFSALTPDTIIVLTDGAVYDNTGVLLEIKRKVTVSERLPLAVAFRGNLDFGETVARRIIGDAEAVGFDQMLRDIAVVLLDFPASPHLEVLIAGISETAGPMHRVFRNKHVGCEVDKPFSLNDPGLVHMGFGSDGRAISLAAMGIPARQGQSLETWLTRYGVDLFEYFRDIPVPIDPADENTDRQYLIGGICDMTVVTRGRVSITTLHRWPDKIGEKIDPHYQLSKMLEVA